MFKLILIILLIIVAGFVIKNLTDRPLTQHLRNKDNKDQREHERHQAEKEREFWVEKNKIQNAQKKDAFIRLFIADYVKTSPIVNDSQRVYIAKRLVEELNNADNSGAEEKLDEIIKRIADK